MNKADSEIDILIAKCFAKEASLAEQNALEEWGQLSEENLAYIQEGYKVLEWSEKAMKVNPDAAWEKLKDRLKASEGKVTQLQPRSKFNQWYAVAATLLVLIGLSWFLGYLLKDKNPSEKFLLSSTNEVINDTLPDGTLVALNRNSTLEFIESNYKLVRAVKLSGEGFFEIAPHPTHEFIIYVGDVRIKDIGTSFNVKETKEGVEVYVKSGIVQLMTDSLEGLTLREGETGKFKKELKVFSKDVVNLSTNAIAYMTRVFEFQNQNLEEVIAQLNEVYGLQIVLDSPELSSCKITVKFAEERIETILDVIAETLNLKVKKNQDQYILEGEKCQ